jgi:hypothetical protein
MVICLDMGGVGGWSVGIGGNGALRNSLGAAMIVEMKGAMVLVQEGRTSIIADAPRECTKCHTMTHFFENKRGETACVSCVVRGECGR